MMVCHPLVSVQGLTSLLSQLVTVHDPLGSVQGLDLTLNFQHVTVRDPLGSVQGLDLTFPF